MITAREARKLSGYEDISSKALVEIEKLCDEDVYPRILENIKSNNFGFVYSHEKLKDPSFYWDFIEYLTGFGYIVTSMYGSYVFIDWEQKY